MMVLEDDSEWLDGSNFSPRKWLENVDHINDVVDEGYWKILVM